MAKNSCLKRRILLFLHFIVVSFQTSSSQSTYSFAPFVDLQSTTPVLQPADSYINFDSLSWHCKNNECKYVHSKYIKFNATGINFNRSYSYYYCYSVATDEVQQLYDITCNGYGSCDLKDKTTNSWPESTITSQIYTYSSAAPVPVLEICIFLFASPNAVCYICIPSSPRPFPFAKFACPCF